MYLFEYVFGLVASVSLTLAHASLLTQSKLLHHKFQIDEEDTVVLRGYRVEG